MLEAQPPGQCAFYCSARLHTINPTSQWNCPGNSPLNYRVWFLVYKALPITFRGSRPPARSLHPLWGSQEHKRQQEGSDPDATGAPVPAYRSAQGRGGGGCPGRWAPAGFPWGHRGWGGQYPGMPFMEDQDDSMSQLGNGGCNMGREEKLNIPNSIAFWQEIKT